MLENTRWQRICVITEYIGADWIDVEVDLQRIDEGDLLRTCVRGINYVDVHSMSPHRPWIPDDEAAHNVIRLGLRQGLLRPEKVIEGGLLTIDEGKSLSEIYLAELDDARAFQRRRRSPIVEVARELKLGPDTDGGASGMWDANCPTWPHRLQLQTSTDLFSCGYCRIGGDSEALRSLDRQRHQDW